MYFPESEGLTRPSRGEYQLLYSFQEVSEEKHIRYMPVKFDGRKYKGEGK